MKIITIILGILAIIGGIICIFFPAGTFLGIGWILGIGMLIFGLNICVAYFMGRKEKKSTVWDLIGGALTIVLSLILLGNTFARFLTDLIAVFMFGGWVFASGVMRIIASFKLKGESKNWIWVLIGGILTVLIGVYAFFHPVLSAFAIGYLIGIAIIMQGANLVAFGVNMTDGNQTPKSA